MRDTELYRHLLGLEAPWEVARVELSSRRVESTCGPSIPDAARGFACPTATGAADL